MQNSVFISHVPSDAGHASKVQKILENAGISCRAGDADDRKTARLIYDSDLFLFIWSEQSESSAKILDRIRLAKSFRMPILSLRTGVFKPGFEMACMLASDGQMGMDEFEGSGVQLVHSMIRSGMLAPDMAVGQTGPSGDSAMLEVRTDLACHVLIDGNHVADIGDGMTGRFRIRSGAHVLKCISVGDWKDTVEYPLDCKGDDLDCSVELVPVRNRRVLDSPDSAFTFKEDSGKWKLSLYLGWDDEHGVERYMDITPYLFDGRHEFYDGLAAVEKDGRWGFIDKLGNEVIPCQFDDAGDFAFGLAPVQSGEWGYIDVSGNVVIPFTYQEAEEFHAGMARVQDGEVTKMIDCSGKVVLDPVPYEYVHYFDEGVALVKNDREGLMNIRGEETVPCMYDDIESLGDNLFCVKNGRYGVIDNHGTVILPCIYEEVCRYRGEEGFVVKRDGTYGMLDRNGKILVPFWYDSIDPYREGLACVSRYDGNKFGYIDRSGNEVIHCLYDGTGGFESGLALVVIAGPGGGGPGQGDLYGFVDRTGRTVVPLQYDFAGPFREGLARVKKGGFWGFIDAGGRVVVPFVYTEAFDFHQGLAKVRKGDEWSFVDKEGRWIKEPVRE